MAKEATIRRAAIKELTEKGWVVSVPIRSRFGSVRLYWDGGSKGCDDFFEVFDLIAWRVNDMRFIQYTSPSNAAARRTKIQEFLETHELSLPPRTQAEVWSYKDRKGFTKKEVIEKLS